MGASTCERRDNQRDGRGKRLPLAGYHLGNTPGLGFASEYSLLTCADLCTWHDVLLDFVPMAPLDDDEKLPVTLGVCRDSLIT